MKEWILSTPSIIANPMSLIKKYENQKTHIRLWNFIPNWL